MSIIQIIDKIYNISPGFYSSYNEILHQNGCKERIKGSNYIR